MNDGTSPQDPRLPALSTAAWAAVLISGLFTLTLGFFPLVARRAADRLLQGRISSAADFLMGFWFGPVLAALALTALVTAVIGNRPPKTRNALAYTALCIALGGTAIVYGALYVSLTHR